MCVYISLCLYDIVGNHYLIKEREKKRKKEWCLCIIFFLMFFNLLINLEILDSITTFLEIILAFRQNLLSLLLLETPLFFKSISDSVWSRCYGVAGVRPTVKLVY